jgi:hypothetical protein
LATALVVAGFDGLTLVVCFLALADSYFQFNEAIFGEYFEWNYGSSLFFGLHESIRFLSFGKHFSGSSFIAVADWDAMSARDGRVN